MITPSPTTKLEPGTARGTLAQSIPATATRPACIVFAIPNTSYELHLLPGGPITAEPGKRLLGQIRGAARRIDIVRTGGRYIEPVAGKPRRVQGTVIGTHGDSLIVDAVVPFHVKPTDPRQKAADFPVGTLVAFDLPEMPAFTQA